MIELSQNPDLIHEILLFVVVHNIFIVDLNCIGTVFKSIESHEPLQVGRHFESNTLQDFIFFTEFR